MSENSTQPHVIDYKAKVHAALFQVVKDVMATAAREGLHGNHHFYLTFLTEAPGVSISESLQAQFPEQMTIVLQHQYSDFLVEDDRFEVTLSFGGLPQRLVVPFDALLAFADPSADFGLQLREYAPPAEGDEATTTDAAEGTGSEGDETDVSASDRAAKEPGKVVSLDRFRSR